METSGSPYSTRIKNETKKPLPFAGAPFHTREGKRLRQGQHAFLEAEACAWPYEVWGVDT